MRYLFQGVCLAADDQPVEVVDSTTMLCGDIADVRTKARSIFRLTRTPLFREPQPHALLVVDSDGNEILRWTDADEMAAAEEDAAKERQATEELKRADWS
jgi:hypothetical protein